MKTYNILSLDDDPKFNSLLKKKIENTNFKLTTTSTVKEFLVGIKQKKWDFCLIDINLSEGEDAGFKVLRYVKNNLSIDTPLILLSRSDEVEKIAHGIECGATDYITKPLDMDMFFTKIQYLLDEEIEITTSLKASPVPSTIRKCDLTTSFQPHSINEDGITLIGPNFVTKGTMLTIEGSFINTILQKDHLNLMVTKNSKFSDTKYLIFLEFGDENHDLVESSKTWIMNKLSESR